MLDGRRPTASSPCLVSFRPGSRVRSQAAVAASRSPERRKDLATSARKSPRDPVRSDRDPRTTIGTDRRGRSVGPLNKRRAPPPGHLRPYLARHGNDEIQQRADPGSDHVGVNPRSGRRRKLKRQRRESSARPASPVPARLSSRDACEPGRRESNGCRCEKAPGEPGPRRIASWPAGCRRTRNRRSRRARSKCAPVINTTLSRADSSKPARKSIAKLLHQPDRYRLVGADLGHQTRGAAPLDFLQSPPRRQCLPQPIIGDRAVRIRRLAGVGRLDQAGHRRMGRDAIALCPVFARPGRNHRRFRSARPWPRPKRGRTAGNRH